MLIWFILVDRSWQPIEGLCLLDITCLADDGGIYNIQEKVKEARPNDLSGVDTAWLLMWRCTEPIQPKNFDDIDEEKFRLQVMRVFSEKKAKGLSSSARIAQLQPEILEQEVFFVQVTNNNWPGAYQFKHSRVANGGFIEQLKACRYEVVPQDLAHRSKWERLFRVLRHFSTHDMT